MSEPTTEPAEAQPAPAQTIDPNGPGPSGPGAIADQAAYDAAKAAGTITELSPEQAIEIETRAEAAERELVELRAAYERQRRAHEKTAEDLRALALAREADFATIQAQANKLREMHLAAAPVVAEGAVYLDRGRPMLGDEPMQTRRRKGDPYSPPRNTPSRAEVAGFLETRDREAKTVGASVLSAISTLGAPGIWGAVLQVVTPVALKAAGALVKALHPDSPGGKKLTRRELRAIADAAADDLQDALWGAFRDRITDGGEDDDR